MQGRSEETSWRADRAATLLWFLVAAALRFALLSRHSLWSDESYSLEDTLSLFTPQARASTWAFPLFFLLERAALELFGAAGTPPVAGERLQLALRVVPALAGSFAAAAAFRSSRGFLLRSERHALAALVAFSPWFLFFSQFARYGTLVLALAIPASFALMRAQRDGGARHAIVGMLLALLAMFTHTTAGFLLVGHVAAALATALLGARRLSRGSAALVVLPVLALVAFAVVPSALRDAVLFKLRAQDAGAESPAALLLGIGWNVGPVVALLAALGFPTLWRRDRALALHAALGSAIPAALLLALAAAGSSVDQRYLLAVVPLGMIPAAVLIGETATRLREAWKPAGVAVPLLALASYAPGVASEYIDGNRHDLAGAAAFLRERIGPGDGIVAETHALLRAWLPPDWPEERLVEAPPSEEGGEEWRRFQAMTRECKRIWIVIPAEFDDFRSPHPEFLRWAWSEGRLVRELWRPRLDYHQNRLRIFLVDDPRAAAPWSRNWRPR